MGEIWKAVDERYEVSDCGEIRNKKGLVLKPAVTKKGYFKIQFWNRKKKCEFIHKLVANAFIGQKPSYSYQINHKNSVPSDNRVENLEWVTCAENIRHNRMSGRRIGAQKLTEHDVKHARLAYWQFGMSHQKIADYFGVTRSTISHVIRGSTWFHLLKKGA
jgi:predicted DNA binding protein